MHDRIEEYIRANLPKTIRSCTENEGTLLALPFPYTVPCVGEMFQELYYWDTYFTNVGLLVRGETATAKHNIDNMLWLVETYGFMPNGNRTYYLNRSQPPFLSRMVTELFAVTQDREWLSAAYVTLKKEYAFWQTEKMTETGLNAYTGYAIRDEDLDYMYEHFVKRTGVTPYVSATMAEKREIHQAVFSFFESGWDCNSRFLTQGHRINAVDLNALLYGMERDLRDMAITLQNDEQSLWQTRMDTRRQLMNTLLWDEEQGLFLDCHVQTAQKSTYRSAASFYPLFVGLADERQAALTVEKLPLFEHACGITAGEENCPWHCQWDYPNVWAPIQYIVYAGLKRYGYRKEARRVADKFTALVERNFDETGNFWEKYNGVTGKVAADEYEAPPMMGWTAGVYTAFCHEREKE